MNSAEFWQFVGVERSAAKDDDHFDALIENKLRVFSNDELIAFQDTYGDIAHTAFTWRVWGAAYLMNSGCSDDGFSDFRAWLISQGQDFFERTLNEPDSLVGFDETQLLERGTYSNLGFIAETLYAQRTGECYMPAPLDEAGKKIDMGQGWDFDNRSEMEKRYPRLFKKYRKKAHTA